jgi:hypothetical protein
VLAGTTGMMSRRVSAAEQQREPVALRGAQWRGAGDQITDTGIDGVRAERCRILCLGGGSGGQASHRTGRAIFAHVLITIAAVNGVLPRLHVFKATCLFLRPRKGRQTEHHQSSPFRTGQHQPALTLTNQHRKYFLSGNRVCLNVTFTLLGRLLRYLPWSSLEPQSGAYGRLHIPPGSVAVSGARLCAAPKWREPGSGGSKICTSFLWVWPGRGP